MGTLGVCNRRTEVGGRLAVASLARGSKCKRCGTPNQGDPNHPVVCVWIYSNRKTPNQKLPKVFWPLFVLPGGILGGSPYLIKPRNRTNTFHPNLLLLFQAALHASHVRGSSSWSHDPASPCSYQSDACRNASAPRCLH